jgi:hypothetical protein
MFEGRMVRKGFNQPQDNNYYFFAVVIDNENKKLLFWENNELQDNDLEFECSSLNSGLPLNFLGYSQRERAKNHFPFYGGVFEIKVFDKALSEDEIRFNHNRYSGLFSKERLSGSTISPGRPRFSLSPENYGSRIFRNQDRPCAYGVKHNNSHSRDLLVFSGNSSAGLDIPAYNTEKDICRIRLKVKSDFRILSNFMKMISIGNNACIGLKKNMENSIYVYANDEYHKAGRFVLGEWNKLSISLHKNTVKISDNFGNSTEIDGVDLAERVYLGDGYPEKYISEADKFEIDVSTIKTEIIDKD